VSRAAKPGLHSSNNISPSLPIKLRGFMSVACLHSLPNTHKRRRALKASARLLIGHVTHSTLQCITSALASLKPEVRGSRPSS
jgi:hypothetical protein